MLSALLHDPPAHKSMLPSSCFCEMVGKFKPIYKTEVPGGAQMRLGPCYACQDTYVVRGTVAASKSLEFNLASKDLYWLFTGRELRWGDLLWFHIGPHYKIPKGSTLCLCFPADFEIQTLQALLPCEVFALEEIPFTSAAAGRLFVELNVAEQRLKLLLLSTEMAWKFD